jgi:hypothetical protein
MFQKYIESFDLNSVLIKATYMSFDTEPINVTDCFKKILITKPEKYLKL